ncbi:MAG: enoyl-CoA hydratase/isomerase family protein [Rhodospirillaceae bacterium]|jgi:enoyl-CoA hydratase|nr:enoyl-CoA hydratase/isomerase family protein [Rhodospirillaceae bacterium]
MTDTVLCEVENAVARVILNRPDKLNALNADMWRAVGEIFGDLSGDASLRCVVLTGQGERAFSPGADIKEFETARADIEKARAYGELMHGAMGEIGACPHPTLAAIRGLCVGGGLELAAMCDLRLCGESSRFGVPINRIGVVMAYPEIAALIDLIGRARAMEILLEGRIYDAAEAAAMGLVNRVVPDAEVEAEAASTARRIAEGAPLVNRWHKKFADRLRNPAPLTPEELDEGFAAFGTADFREGYRAFVEKRKPVFEGR